MRVAGGFDKARLEGVRTIALASHEVFRRALVTEHHGLSPPEDWKHGSALLEYEPTTASLARA